MYLRKNDVAVPKRIGTIASPRQKVCDKTMIINYNTKEQEIEKLPIKKEIPFIIFTR